MANPFVKLVEKAREAKALAFLKLQAAATAPSLWWNGQRTNALANERRAVKRLIGARQYRKQRKALALAARSIS